MVVKHNIVAMNSNRMLSAISKAQAKSTEKLSSGYKINRAADDAAGLSISEKMRKQIRGLTQAAANAQDGISAVQTAEGALTEVHDMLQRMNELAVKSANGTNSKDDRDYIQAEVDQLVTEIDRVALTTKFNETYLLKGTSSNGTPGELTYSTVKAKMYDVMSDSDKARASIDSEAGSMKITANTAYTSIPDVKDKAGKIINAQYGVINIGNKQYVDIHYLHGPVVDSTSTVYGDEHDGITLADAADAFNADAKARGNKNIFFSSDTYELARKIKEDFAEDVKNVSVTVSNNYTTIANLELFSDVNDKLSFNLHVGADSTKDNKISVGIGMMSARGLGVNGIRVNGSDDSEATKSIDTIAKAIRTVSSQRSALGAVQNRLEHTIRNLDNVVENTTSAEAAIRDTDMATEMVRYSNNRILAQAGQAMLAQSNQSNQGVLALLG